MCPPNSICVNEVCTCSTGLNMCLSTGQTSATCKNYQTDSNNCGSCNNKCLGVYACSSGVCRSTCGGATITCGATNSNGANSFCAYWATDNNNCGKNTQ